MKAARWIIAVAVSSANHALAQPGGERLVPPPQADFVVGYSRSNGGASIEERVPRGETVEDWTRMITIQRFPNPAGLSGEELLRRMAEGLVGSCPGGRFSTIAATTIDSRPASAMRGDCPRNPATGKPETLFARATAIAGFLHIAQVAFRRVPTGTDAGWAERILSGLRLCATPDCRR